MTNMCIAAANYIVTLTNQYNEGKPYSEQISMTCKRLQKLLYFSEIEYMKYNNWKPMLKDDFYAWPSGPVIPSVYYKFTQFQDGTMAPIEGEHTPLTSEMKKAIQKIFEDTAKIDTYDLVEMSHAEDGPWKQVYDPNDKNHGQIITRSSMREFFETRDTLFNTPAIS